MTTGLIDLATAIAAVLGLPEGGVPMSPGLMAVTAAFITVPLGILFLILSRVFRKGKFLGLVAGYKEYGVAQPERMGRFVGNMVAALGIYLLVFPLTVRLWANDAFVAFIFVVVGMGVAIIIGSARFEKG